jgi:hypothetical protein
MPFITSIAINLADFSLSTKKLDGIQIARKYAPAR